LFPLLAGILSVTAQARHFLLASLGLFWVKHFFSETLAYWIWGRKAIRRV
jgi:hypothetical protein